MIPTPKTDKAVLEPTREVVRRQVVAERLSGATLAAIADSFNRGTVPTAAGGNRWMAGTNRALLVREGVA